MNNLPVELKEVLTTSSLSDLTKAEQIASNYAPFMNEVSEQMKLLKVLKKGNKDDVAKAKRIKLDLGKICSRTTTQKETDKASILLEGRFVDALFNTVNGAARITQGEAQEIEHYFEKQEKERLVKIQSERVSLLSEFVDAAAERDLATMEEDVWVPYLASKKKDFELLESAKKQAELDRIKKEKEVEAEEKRLKKEREEETKRIEAENKRLLKEREELEAKAKIEREEREAKEKIQREENEAKLKKQREIREESDRVAEVMRKKLQAQIDKKNQEEADRVAESNRKKLEEEQKREEDLSKGDEAKIVDLISDLESLKTKYEFKSAKSKKMMASVIELIGKIISFIQK